jgi:DNA-binding protein HU-beta
MAKGMNRAELNEQVAKSMDCSKAQADRAVGSVLESIQKGLKRQGEVSIVGFGTFKVKKRAARDGRNPRTGETIKIKASKSVGFKAGKPLKSSL